MSDKLPKFELVAGNDDAYTILREVVASFHHEIADAAIALVWVNDVKPDRDGKVVLGRAKKVGELEREFHEHDFIIMLNKRVWQELPLTHRRALLDHECSHCGSEENEKTGELTWCLHKHDVEEFVPIVRRYGLWKQDVEALVNAALKREQKGLFEKDGEEQPAEAAAAEAGGE